MSEHTKLSIIFGMLIMGLIGLFVVPFLNVAIGPSKNTIDNCRMYQEQGLLK